jgi:hypothetical protein
MATKTTATKSVKAVKADNNTAAPENAVEAVKPVVKIADAATMKLVDEQKAMMQKMSGKLVMPEPKPAETKEAKGESKVDKARAIMAKHFGKLSRKEILAQFAQIGLSPAGSATYYANISKELSKK